MIVSPKLLYELQEVLSRDKFRRYLSMREVGEYVLWLEDGATSATDPETVTLTITRDPRDDYLAALASSERADFLVSGDPHLLGLEQIAASGLGSQVRVLTPKSIHVGFMLHNSPNAALCRSENYQCGSPHQ